MLMVDPAHLRDATLRIFEAAGAPSDVAAEMAEFLVESNLAGHDSHGVIRIPAYLQAISDGLIVPDARPEVIEETATSALVDGKDGFGHIAAAFATDVAARKARDRKVAVVSIVRCNHIGRLGEWGSRAARQGVVAIITVGGSGGPGIAAPFGGAAPALGTNPISVGMPAGDGDDLLMDFATTTMAEGKVQVARAKGASLPPGVLLDREGHPSTNPQDLYNGGMLLPFGGHKGYGLALVVELLGAALTPGQRHNRGARSGGAVIIAVDAAAFRPLAEFEATATETLRRVKAIPPAPGFSEVLVPGEPERQTRAERVRTGIPLAEVTWHAIVEAARGLAVVLPSTPPDTPAQ
jgi:hydroxycarboxylate dehydrogenase B